LDALEQFQLLRKTTTINPRIIRIEARVAITAANTTNGDGKMVSITSTRTTSGKTTPTGKPTKPGTTTEIMANSGKTTAKAPAPVSGNTKKTAFGAVFIYGELRF
jgi:hypothetical protein